VIKTLDLFSGIGGFSLGLEATGFFETTCFVENDPYCQAVLRHHWPEVPILGDIKDVKGSDLPTRPDLVCGGFPCQPFSHAGKQQAQDDPRHLWPEMFRIIRELRPTWVCGENVTGLVRLGLDEVLTDLEGEGYATRTFNIPACAVGAPHLRQRLWIVAHSDSESEPDGAFDGNARQRQLGFEFGGSEATSYDSDPDDHGSHRAKKHKQNTKHRQTELRDKQVCEFGQVGEDVADTNSNDGGRECGSKPPNGETRLEHSGSGERSRPEDHWSFEPEVGRLVNGLPNRVPQLRALGNSIIPQIAKEIGYAIGKAHYDRKSRPDHPMEKPPSNGMGCSPGDSSCGFIYRDNGS